MESNIPVVGSEQPEQDVAHTAAPPAEAANGTANDQPVQQPELENGSTPSASTPDEVEKAVENPGEPQAVAEPAAEPVVESTDEPQAAAEPAAEPAVESTAEPGTVAEAAPGDQMQTLLDQSQDEPQVKKGDILEGTVARTTPTEILVDVGLKSEGVISGKEL